MKIKDIALKAGVSTATVSNVINGNHHKVSQATIEKVQKIIEEMGYSPSATARSLASKESRIIGVVIPNLGKDQVFSINAYTSQAIARLEKYVRNKGYYLMIRSVEQCKEIVPIFSGWNVDGVILLGAFHEEVAEIEKLLKVPTVYTDTYAKDLPIANVGIDDYKGGMLMGRYLLGKGHTKIALVTPDVNSPGVIQQRYRGFCDALKSRGLEMSDACIFVAETNADSGCQAGQKIALADQGFTAVATMSDMAAIGVMSGLRMYGLRVPEDVSVMGFDNLRAGMFVHPPLTTIAQDIAKKCDTVGDILFDMIENKKTIVVNKTLDVELVERQSVKNIN